MQDNKKPSGEVKARAQIAALSRLPGVKPLSLPKGQVLVYRGHLCPGLFLLHAGAVILEPMSIDSLVIPTSAPETPLELRMAPLLVPPLPLLDTPLSHTVRIARDSQLLFVPRTLLASSEPAQQAIEQLSSSWPTSEDHAQAPRRAAPCDQPQPETRAARSVCAGGSHDPMTEELE